MSYKAKSVVLDEGTRAAISCAPPTRYPHARYHSKWVCTNRA
jgi:hypothetical protein